ncbi:MAG: NADH:flavin oxidoreductase [Bdellovibrionaceae bacterium]|nr:NADH:flavin oxidoreductase [Pseudobdellovibrionaceae bacterium]
MSLYRFSQYPFRNGKQAQNRVVVPPMASKTADADGFVTDASRQHYQRLAEANAGIIFVEYSFVHQTGKGEANQMGASNDQQIAGLADLAAIIQKKGSLAGLQLVHAGGKTTTEITGTPLMAPSSIMVPVKDRPLEIPVSMTVEQIQEWVESFVQAAHRADKAGFDFVELHAAHGYGINQWLSPITNQRFDEYGVNIQGRSKLLFDIINRIKLEIPNILVAVRMPAQDHSEGGLEVHEMFWVVKQLENLGVDLIDVSSGIGGWRRQDGRTTEGYLVSDAALLKQSSSLPVIGVGGIETGKFIDEIICQRKVDFAAVGRAILKGPREWALVQMSS